MNLNLTKITFITLMMFSSMMAISSSNWLSMWMGLELNLFTFIPILNFKMSIYSIESTMKYFLIQAFASIILLMFMINKSLFFMIQVNMMMIIPLLMKLSLMPFHLWMPSMIEGLNWMSCFLLMTWQKITPMIMISYLNLNKSMIFIITLLSLNNLFGMNQNSIRKILAMSSINNSSWMLIAITMNENLWMNYFLIYSMLNMLMIYILWMYKINYINQLKFFNFNFFFKLNMLMLIFSIMGLPPMLGFLMKWMLIKTLIYNKMIMILIMLITTAILNLYFYLKLTYFLLFNFNLFNKWFIQNKKNNNFNIILFMNFFSLFFSSIIFY
uniref:NADH-ubiquinone oxidoreductase chain 2 n=1 Tax=Kaburagia rhusicola ovogallis TaxID=384838 RepID=A0A1Z1MWG2_9HEMI|nr:NADH dehydrogenase subunit 2 [Kaburagia rhusicola ovogallis]ARW70313.1 NADH dehydrogenase subunit 2 [Kaburagia rhusicola ovogallis]UIE11115.1 NADH dehydrogenase subunit 2 [Kaburagia rhusicola ovogallis]UIE11128.1 NADH dehydrogenase subunit 2 [Kaburagia rhusicola ovogallis]UIE11141.1 NADH dehydrogenase subunit 2 [Kaburagia rhusicola ovogallis]UIE11154.1 NADH dehydrogenase subunit 2 [Kaburagia rhusicola ovogallis]